MKSLILVLALFIVAAAAQSDEEQWELFKIKYNKNYHRSKEEQLRKSIFMKKLEEIKQHNEKYEKKEVSWSMGINHMADYTEEEKQSLLGYKPLTNTENSNIPVMKVEGIDLPKNFSWIGKGIMTPAKDQKHCGSCWAFATTEVTESANAIKTGILEVLSPQNLMDCDKNSDGCDGTNALKHPLSYVMENGIELEEDYPYEAEKYIKCRADKNKFSYKISNFTSVKSDQGLMEAVLKAPVIISVGASSEWFSYNTGIITDCSLGLNHAIVLVGFGEEGSEKYWIIRNSWGTAWGDNGYAKLSRNKKNMCGITEDACSVVA